MIKIIDKRDEEPKSISISEMKIGQIGMIINHPEYSGHYVLRCINEALDLSCHVNANWHSNSDNWNNENMIQLLPKNEKIVIEIYNI